MEEGRATWCMWRDLGIWGGLELGSITESTLRLIFQRAQCNLCLTLMWKFKEWFPTPPENL